MGSDVTASRPTWRTAFALPDSRLELWEDESSYSAASPIAGVPEGSVGLRPVMTGTPTSTDAIELETMRGGYSDGGAAFRWRFSDGEWQYQVPLPRLSESTIIAHDGSTQVVHMDAAQQSNGRPILVTSGQATGRRITVHRLTAAGVWVSVVVIELTKSSDIIPAIVALPDGSLSIYVDLGGVRRFTSTDDGASWDEVPVRFNGTWTQVGIHSVDASVTDQLQVAVGDGKMMMIVRDSVVEEHYASEDYGTTWETIRDTTVASTGAIALTHSSIGFLYVDVQLQKVVSFPDPFSSTSTTVHDYSGNSLISPDFADFVEFGGILWMVEVATDVDIRARGRWHQSADGGATWAIQTGSGPGYMTDSTIPLSVDVAASVVVAAGTGEAYLFEASNLFTSGYAPGVAAHRLAGWSSQKATLTNEGIPVGWSMVYSPLPGVTPDYAGEVSPNGTDTLGTMATSSVGGVTASSSAGLGLVVVGASNGDEVRWSYEPETTSSWFQEADVEVTAGQLKLSSVGTRRVRVVVDGDAGTVGMYEAADVADEKVETLIGSTTPLPSGVITLRLIHSVSAATSWYRLAGSTEWIQIATTASLTALAGLTNEAELLTRAGGTTLAATVHGWRVMEIDSNTSLVNTTPAGGAVAPWTADGVYLDAGQSVQAQGFTSYADAWTSTPSADYSPSQLLPSRPSPRHRFESTVDTVQTLAFRVPEQEMAPSHAILIQATNARTCRVDIWTTTAGAWVTYGTVDLSRSWDDYTVLGDRRVKLGVSASSSTQGMSYVGPDELVGSTFVDSAGDLHTVVSNTEGALAPAGSGGHLGQRAILELDGTPSATGTCELWFASASAIAHHDKDIVVEGVRLTFTGLVSASPQVASGALTVGNAVVAPMTWLSEGPDQTRTEVFEVREELDEQDDGHEYTTRSAPDRRRYELNFARLLPMYGSAAGSWDWWEATDDGEQAATPWTLPQTLSRFLGKAGRRPFVYIPAIPYHATGGQSLQPFQAVDGGARLVRCISGPFRLEGVLGQAATADQLVRGSTITLREVV